MKSEIIKHSLGGGRMRFLLIFAFALAAMLCHTTAALAADPVYDVSWTEWNPTTGVLTLKAGKSGEAGVPTATSGNIWRCDETSPSNWQARKTGIVNKIKRFTIDKSYYFFPTQSINYFFRDMTSLERVDGLEYIYLRNLTNDDLSGLFKNCTNLKIIQGMECWSYSPDYIYEMFYGCESLLWVDISGITTGSVINMDKMFYNCKNLRKVWVYYSDFNKFYHGSYDQMFIGCYNNAVGMFEYMPTNKKEEMYAIKYDNELYFFNDKHKLAGYSYCYSLNEGTNTPGWSQYASSITKVVFAKSFRNKDRSLFYYYQISPKSFYKWFYNASNLTEIEGWDSVIGADLENASYMFYGCSKLKTDQVQGLFSRDIRFSSSCKNFSYMFYNCSQLNGRLSLQSTSYEYSQIYHAENLSYMFYGCKNLEEIQFGKCIKKSSWSTTQLSLKYTTSMFEGCEKLKRLLMSSSYELDLTDVTESTNMFKGCSALVGGCGTQFNASYPTDKTYAKVDEVDYSSYKDIRYTKGYFSLYDYSIRVQPNFGGVLPDYTPNDYQSTYRTYDDPEIEFTISFANENLPAYGMSFKRLDCVGGYPYVGSTYSYKVKIPTGVCGDVTIVPILATSMTSKNMIVKPERETYDGKDVPLVVQWGSDYYTLVKGTDYTLTSITPDGKINKAGNYQVALQGTGDNYTGSKTFTVTLNPAEITVTPKPAEKTYGDTDPDIEYTVEGLIGSDVLTGALSYDKTQGENAGTHKITLGTLANSNYNITVADVDFTIKSKKVTNLVITTESAQYPYTGGEIKPVVAVYDGITLIPSSEYTVSYKNNKEIGDGKIIITDNPGGNYEVSGSGTFQIVDQSEAYTVTVNYIDFEGTTQKTLYVIKNGKLSPTILKEEGYTLLGLYNDEGCNNEFNFNIAITSDNTVLYAKWKINQHRLILTVEGTEIVNKLVNYGSEIIIPNQADIEGKSLVWDIYIPQTMPDNDLTAIGTYVTNKHTITYTVDGLEYKKLTGVEYGTPIEIEGELIKTGYKFSGWTPSTLPATMPDEDITVKGTFTPNKHTVTFVIGETNIVVETQFGVATASIFPKTNPGYKFVPNGDYPATVPDQNIFIAGKWEETTYFLTYILDGNEYKKIELHYKDPITPLADPVKEGYTFSGWSTIPTKMPGDDVIITGSLIPQSYKLIYMIDNTVYREFTYKFGDRIKPLTEPVKMGQTFSGWSEIPQKMPSHDVTITGSFTGTQTAINTINAEAETKVWAYNHTIYIETAPDTKYTIVDLQGRVITTSTTKSTHDEINIATDGLLIVIINNQSYKISL